MRTLRWAVGLLAPMVLLSSTSRWGATWAASKAAPKVTVSAAKTKVAMIFDAGGKNDRGFNESANRGLLRATTELGVRSTVHESRSTTRTQQLEALAAQQHDLVIGVGFLFSDDIVKVAAKFPKQKFAVIDFAPSGKVELPPNVLGLSFREEQGAYLVGVLAAHHSQTNKVAFVGGMDAAVLRRFAKGFEAGAKSVKPTIALETVWIDKSPAGFTNPGKGKAAALELYGKGVDTIFHASGATGLGIFDAAKEKRQWAIGVDRTNWKDLPGLMPATMVKHIDQAVFAAIASLQDGSWKGGVKTMDLASGGVGLEWNQLEPQLVPAELRKHVEAAAQELTSGKRTVPAE